ncbi:MAG: hypothetical protein ACRD3F_05500 [Acidobacteriaceae bacterium]
MDQHQLNALSGIVLLLMPIVFLVFMAILVLPYWFIWKKAGFSPWLSLLMFIPLVNLVMLYVLAFSQWRVVPAPQPLLAYYPPQPTLPTQG